MSSDAHTTQDFDIRRYLEILRRRKVTVIVTMIVTVALAVGISLTQEKVYQADGKILLGTTSSDQLADLFGFSGTTDDRVATEIEVMQSAAIRDAVTEELGRAYNVSLEAIPNTSVVKVTAKSSSGERAAEIVNVFSETYIDTRRAAIEDQLDEQIVEVQRELDTLAVQYATTSNEVQIWIDRIQALPPEVPGQPTSPERTALEDQRDAAEERVAPKLNAIENQRLNKQNELDQLNNAKSLLASSGSTVTSQAEAPSSPVSPKPLRNGLLAIAIGLVLGIILALLREQFDDTLRTKDDLEGLTGGRPVLGIIPTVSGWRDQDQTQVVSVIRPLSPAAEAYRTLRTSVQFLSIDRPVHKIQVTSPNQGDGKSTTVANLAVALARAGRRVAIVDCDLRRPRVGAFFGMEMSPGFTSVLLGDVALADALQSVPDEPRLSLLASGMPPPNPSELLSTKRARQVLDELTTTHDVVLIDTPPVLPVTDALLLSHMVDATVLVASAGRTSRRSVRRAMELLEQVDSNIEGTVLNAAPDGESYGTGYGYGYGYGYNGSDGEPKERGRRGRKADAPDPSTAATG